MIDYLIINRIKPKEKTTEIDDSNISHLSSLKVALPKIADCCLIPNINAWWPA